MTASTADVVRFDSVQPNRRRGGDLRVLLSPATVGATAGFTGIVRLEPGEHVSEHYHPYSDEFLVVTDGRVRVRVNGEPVELERDQAVMITRGARHRLENHGDEPAQAVFFLAPLAPRPEVGHVDTEAYPAERP